MKRKLPVWVLASFMASAASADEAEERLRAAIARIADDDPEVRAAGRARLFALASERPDLVRRIADHPDAEVGATARRVLFDHCIQKDLVDQKRFDEILASIGDPQREAPARRELFRTYLDLGHEPAALLSSELMESQAKSMLESVTLKPGDSREIEFRMRNVGAKSLWYNPECYSASAPTFERFGGGLRYGGRLGGRRNLSSLSAQERILGALSTLRRVPPGGDFVLASVFVESDCCGLFRLRVQGGGASDLKAAFHGVDIPATPASLGELPSVVIPFLAQRESVNFEATLLPRGPSGRPALRIKAIAAVEERCATCAGCVDSFWWAATDEAGRYLGSGPMRGMHGTVDAWTESQERTVEMPFDPPLGTRRLWLGFDGADSSDQAVPSPLEIPAAGAVE
ncbi:MAG: hypothetical protein AAB074_01425 [Planctomycetota bacterium]